MTESDITLDELERDALTEIVNIGVSRAAVSLRKMVGKQVLLSVPAVEVLTQKVAASFIGQRETGQLVAIRQEFQGDFAGHALLILPEANSLDLVRAIVGDGLDPSEVTTLKDEALAETGNVILSACLGTIGNLLKQPLHISLPKVLQGDGDVIFPVASGDGSNSPVLFLYIDFSVQNLSIRGYFAMIMDLPSLAILKTMLGDFVARITGDSNWTMKS